MSSSRTSLLLDQETRRAARQLAKGFDCSVSEAIRRAVLLQRDRMRDGEAKGRTARLAALERLVELFADNDADDEIRRLKSEDEGF